jgi:tetratricopeptide (TPR) repeat protein
MDPLPGDGDPIMRQFFLFSLVVAALATVAQTGCSKKQKPPLEAAAVPAAMAPGGVSAAPGVPPPSLELGPQEKYDAALLEALNQIADKKYAEALVSLGTARALQDTEQVHQEIDRVKNLIEQQAVAARTAQDIKAVIDEGKPEEAARIAAAGLEQFGPTDEADKLAQLKRQADALAAAQGNDNDAQFQRFEQEGTAAVGDRNWRAAAIAFEQALQYREDANLRRQLGDLQAALALYDDNRKRAAELRRDPAHLEEAIAALKEAQRAWDTVQVRQELDDFTLALQKRRDRISVADFEVRGEVGIPSAGRTLAEELLPAFRPRFDLVEREQINKVVGELQLEASDLAENDSGRREVGRLARIRYLVLGSITPQCGITVNARLIEAQSGLVVQTAKLIAASPEEVLRRLPELARLLTMSDEEKCAYEQQQAQQAAVVIQPVAIAPLPPPPEVVVVGQPLPPPIVVYNPRPPDWGGLRPDDFDRLPLFSGQAAPFVAAQVDVESGDALRQRLLQISVSLGDNLFRRGRYQEAQRHFELAFNLSPGHLDLQVRLDRCRSQLPPPPPPPRPEVVVVTPPAVVIAPPPRPRIVVVNFLVNADPGLAPPGLGDWAADQLAACYAPTYEVVDGSQLNWYLAATGGSVRDLAVNASARLWLGRALGVRFFAFGVVQQTASFTVTTHLVDVETGQRQGVGSIHVQDHQELKLRMAELVRQTHADPAERDRLAREAQENERRLNEARRLLQGHQPAQAAAVCRAALQQQPGNIGLQALLQQADHQVQETTLEETRRRQAQERQAQATAEQARRQQLARQAEEARQRAQREAANRDQAARQALEQKRQQSGEQLLLQGRKALADKNYAEAVRRFESAVAIQPTEAARQELAQARALAERATRDQAVAEQARRDAETRRQREADLARIRAQVDEQRRSQPLPRPTPQPLPRSVPQPVSRPAPQSLPKSMPQPTPRPASQSPPSATQRAAYARQLETAAAFEKQAKYDQAIASYQEALRLVPGDVKATAALHMAQGRKALQAKRFPEAAREFEEVLRLQPQDAAAAAALKQARQGRS